MKKPELSIQQVRSKYRLRRDMIAPMMGNKLAAKDNMSEESHKRRMEGLFKAWERRRAKFVDGRIKLPTHRNIVKRRRRLYRKIERHAAEVQRRVRELADASLGELENIINNPSTVDSVKLQAISLVFDRGYGKAVQTNANINASVDGKPSEVSGKELDERIAQALGRIEELTGRKTEAKKGKKRPADVREPDRDPNRPPPGKLN